MTPLPRLTPLQWLICGIAALGFAFDIYEVLMAPLVVGPAIGELTGAKPGTPAFNYWVGMFFWIPAIVGGIFGLLGGNIFQGEQGLDQMAFMRPTPALAQYATPVEGLYLCGAGTHPGGGVMAAEGGDMQGRAALGVLDIRLLAGSDQAPRGDEPHFGLLVELQRQQ